MSEQEHEFELGRELKDKVSGFRGIATARVVYINGCIQYCITPQVDKDGKYVDGLFIDVARLEQIGDGILGPVMLGNKTDEKVPPRGGPSSRGETPPTR